MLKIAIVGLGGMGTVHKSNFNHIQDVEVVAAVGVSHADKEKAQQWNIPIYDTIENLVNEIEVDVIDICTPTFLHPQNVADALNAGKHVICEKPLALRSQDAKDLYKLANKKGLHLYVAQVVQFTKQMEVLREVVKDERFGKPLDAVFERLSAKPSWGSDSWMFDKEKAGLIPFDLHIHDLDMIVSLFGKPLKKTVQETRGKLAFPEHYRFLYEYENLNVVAEAAWFNANIPFIARWHIYFEEAYLVNDGINLIAYPAEGDAIKYDVEETNKIETGINVPPTEMYLNELKHFVACIKEGIDSPYVSSEQVISTLEILESIAD